MQVLLLFAGFTSTAHAHLVVKGLDEVGNGALHPFVTPSHVMIILALGLLLGQRVPFTLKTPVLALASSSAAALVFATTGWVSEVYQPVLIGIALCIAILVAVGRKLPDAAYAVLCAVAVLGIGLDSAPETGTAYAMAKTLLGTWLALNLVIPYIAICASNGADKPWAKTAIQIAGSWIIAISVLVLAFALRK